MNGFRYVRRDVLRNVAARRFNAAASSTEGPPARSAGSILDIGNRWVYPGASGEKGNAMKRSCVVGLASFLLVACLAADASAMYHPTLGRFLSRDPAAYADGLHLYCYARSAPASYVDWDAAEATRPPGGQASSPSGPAQDSSASKNPALAKDLPFSVQVEDHDKTIGVLSIVTYRAPGLKSDCDIFGGFVYTNDYSADKIAQQPHCCQELRFVQVVQRSSRQEDPHIDPALHYYRQEDVDYEPFYHKTNKQGDYRYGSRKPGWSTISAHAPSGTYYDVMFEDHPSFTIVGANQAFTATTCLACVTQGRSQGDKVGQFRLLRCFRWGYRQVKQTAELDPKKIEDLGSEVPGGEDGYFRKALTDFNKGIKGQEGVLQWELAN